MKRIICIYIVITFIATSLIAQQKHALNFDDLWAMKRIGAISLSVDGKMIAFQLTSYNVEKNKGNSDIYIVNTDGANLRELKNSEKNESEPKFLPDGKHISYVMGDQVWICNLDGTADKKITDVYTGISGVVWSNDGKRFLFASSVYVDCLTQDCNKEKDKLKDSSKVKASLFTELMYRHWDSWRENKRSHLFLYDTENNKCIDLNLQKRNDAPPLALGSDNDYSFSPDGKEIAFTMNETEMVAANTNNDIFLINVDEIKDGRATPYKKISLSQGNDNQPVYSPDGKYIAYVSMERAGFEADRQRIMLYDRAAGTTKDITQGFDRSAGQLVWSPDSKLIYFDANNEIYNSFYKADVKAGKIEPLLVDHYNTSINITPDGKTILFKQQRTDLPYEIFSLDLKKKDLKQITFINKDKLDNIQFSKLDTIWYEGAGGTKVQAIIIKPPFFDPNKTYPMMFLIHGGPQGHWSDDFHYRWNLQMFSAPGYVLVAPNPRGSTGYGQKFTDEITGDWAGKVFVDLMNCYDYVIKNYSFVDKNNTFAAGASYGGYMINWIEGHTDRFKALLCHDGVFNLESMYGSTEELWFPEWEYGGTPWQNREFYRKWSPHQYVQNFKTPMLVVHGANDFRVPESQAFELFTSLQKMKVESEFLYFPDETHFVVKPQNARLWWSTFFNWFGKHYKGDKL